MDHNDKPPFSYFGIQGAFDPTTPTMAFSMHSINLFIPFLLLLLAVYSCVSHVYTSTARKFSLSPSLTARSVYQALQPLSSALQLSVRALLASQHRSDFCSCGSSPSPAVCARSRTC